MKSPLTYVLTVSAVGVSALTDFTGDTLQGYSVIEHLDLADVPANTVSRFWISAGEAQGGSPYSLPIFVARGTTESSETGRKLSLSASIHGGELNGIRVMQRVFQQHIEVVSSGGFNGTIVGLPTQKPSRKILNQRNMFTNSSNGFLTNLNRVFPSTSLADGGSLPTSFAYTIGNNIWGNKSNVDIAVDLHALSTGSAGPLWAYADVRLDGIYHQIDPGEPGSIETTWVDNGVPAITLEIGPAKNWNQTLIKRSEEFVWRLLDDMAMLPSNYSAPAETLSIGLENTFRATTVSYVSVSKSGWAEYYVAPLEDVEEGQQLGTVYTSWGDTTEELAAAVSGRVLAVRVDPAVEQRAGVVDIAYNATAAA